MSEEKSGIYSSKDPKWPFLYKKVLETFLKQKRLVYAIAFLLPALVVTVVMIRLGIAPFGDTSVFIWDAKLQHKDYYGYLWDVLHGEASLQYAVGKSLGGRMFGIIGFYISSPLNLLLFFFKKSQISEFMATLIILKVGLSGLTSQFYLKKRFGLNFFPAICFSTAYALMEYNVLYCRNMMWMDGVIMLPLIACGVWKVVSEKKVTILWITSAVAIISNWYTGYMVCLFSGFLFIYECCVYHEFHLIRQIKSVIKTSLLYVGAMLGGVAVSAFMLMPALLGLISGKATNNFEGLTGIQNFGFLHFFSALDIEAAGNSQTAPVIYCGALLVFCVVYYFFYHRNTVKERILSLVFVLFMIFSFCYRDVELLWTAYIRSTSYYFRFSFLFVFLCTMLAGSTMSKVQEKGMKKSLSLLVVVLAGIAGIYLSRIGELPLKNTILAMIYGCLLMMAYDTSGDTPFWNQICRTGTRGIILILTVAELGYNTQLAFEDYNDSNKVYAEYTEAMEDVLDEIDESEDTFYRLEKTFSYLSVTGRDVATCESLFFGFNSIEHYSSAYDIVVDNFLARVGYSDWVSGSIFPCETYWNAPLTVMDSLLSVKYMITDQGAYGYTAYETDAKLSDESYTVYQNEYALSLGYNIAADSEVEIAWTDNPYENQELFVSTLLGEDTALYTYIDGLCVSVTNQDDSSDESDGSSEEDNGHETWKFAVTEDGPVYLYVDGSEVHSNCYQDNCVLYVDGEKIQKICKRFLINSVYLGEYEAGDVIEVDIEHVSNNMADHTLYMAQLDTEAFENCIRTLQDGSESHLNVDGNVVEGTYVTEEDTVAFLSIPYEDSWIAYVDGEKVELKNILGTFIGIELSAGEHEIKLVYTTPGWNIGCVLSILGLIALVLVTVLRRRNVAVEDRQETEGEEKNRSTGLSDRLRSI